MSDDNILEFREVEGPVLTMRHPPVNITFTKHDGTTVGEFVYNEETGKWSFNGDMEESAEKFIQFLTEVIAPRGA